MAIVIPDAVVLTGVFCAVFHVTMRALRVWIDAAPDAMPRRWCD